MTATGKQVAGAGFPLRDKLAQLMFVRIGSNLPPVRTVEEDEERVAKLLDACPVGGLILFNGTYASTPQTLARLQERSRRPLLVSADLERGVGQQLRGYPLFPHAMAFDALGAGASDAVFRFAELTGRASRAAGVHITFGPVADVNSDPRNPIISTRAFSSDSERAAELAAAFVRGCTAGGLLATAKHFPGHGNTHEDSHHALPTVEATRDEIRRRELPPFEAAIAAGAPLVMTAHVRYPSLDPTGAAATLSRPILTALLRGRMNFEGAVVSDSLLMEGVKVGCASEGELALIALNAGVDILLDVAEPVSTLDALMAAVANGQLSEARVDEALVRVTRLKALASAGGPVSAGKLPPFDEAQNRRETDALALDIARRAVIQSKNDGGLLPFRPERSTCAVLVNPFPLPSNAEPPPLGKMLSQRFSHLHYVELGADPPEAQLEELRLAAMTAEQFLAAFVVKPAAWHRFGLPSRLRDWLRDLAAARPTVAACLGAPQGLEPLSSAAVQLCTFSDVPVS
ncbi:MAG TPA: glycoside hydrolase family 3 protein, partial [Lacipirellula sp.]